jgi:hypothetical protein
VALISSSVYYRLCLDLQIFFCLTISIFSSFYWAESKASL